MEEHCSHSTHAVSTPTGNYQHTSSITNVQQAQREEYDQEDGHSLQMVDVAPVPPVRSERDLSVFYMFTYFRVLTPVLIPAQALT